jgi:hypothetical protein
MTVHKYFFTLFDVHVNLLQDYQNFLVWSYCMIFPKVIKICYTSIVEYLWIIAEPNFIWNKTISTQRMLTRLFKIENCCYILLLKLLDYVELVYKTCSRSLRSDQIFVYQITVKSLYNYRVFSLFPVFTWAEFSVAKEAQQLTFFLKFTSFYIWRLIPFIFW